jgi:hypothetical protein
MPPQLAGLIASAVWMVLGSLAPQMVARPAHHRAH